MSFNAGEIVLVRFPFTNQTGSKQRPAAVLSTRAYNQARPDVIIGAVTSQLRPGKPFGDKVLTDWRSAGLLKPSAVKPVVATIEQALVIRTLGVLQAADQASVRAMLKSIFGP